MEYTDVTRGKPQIRERMKQIINFDGMKYGENKTITPMDIDLFFEERGNTFVFAELKYGSAIQKFGGGQKLALERLADALFDAGRQSVVFLCRHNVKNRHADVMARTAHVEKVYYNHKWHDWNGGNLNESIESFVTYANKERSIT